MTIVSIATVDLVKEFILPLVSMDVEENPQRIGYPSKVSQLLALAFTYFFKKIFMLIQVRLKKY